MKKLKIWSMMMLVAMALPMMVACGSDKDDEGGSNVNYTTDEIVEMLNGKWAISGHVKCTSNQKDISDFTGDYTGTIEFTSDQRFTLSSSKMPYKIQGDVVDLPLENILVNKGTYTILKKNGKNYVQLKDYSLSFNFLIQSLSKNSFKLVEDEDITFDYYTGDHYEDNTMHYYITMYSN